MPTLVNAETDERDALLSFLDAQRGGLRRAAYGLTEEQAASAPTVSSLSLTLLIRHAARVEQHWVDNLTGRAAPRTMQDWADEYRLPEGDSLAEWLRIFEEVATETDRIIRSLASLEVDFPLPDAPWFPPNSRRTARWMLLSLIQEQARHAGHADIIRQTLDGRTAFELVDLTQSA